jgi:hypothetical protein
VLDGLLAPLRLPERVVEALESLPAAARELGQVRVELTRVREQTEPLAGLMPAVEGLLERTERLPEMVSVLDGRPSRSRICCPRSSASRSAPGAGSMP